MILTTSAIQKEWLEKDFPSLDDKKIEVVHNGVFSTSRPPTAKTRNKTILYCGRLNQNQGVENIAHFIRLLPDYQFQIFGCRDDAFAQHGFALLPNVKREGYIARERLLEVQSQVDFSLISLSDSYQYAIPTKLFESIETNTPVLAIVPPQGAAHSLVTKEGLGLATPPDQVEKLAEQLRHLTDQQYGDMRSNIASAKERYARLAQTQKLQNLIEQKLLFTQCVK